MFEALQRGPALEAGKGGWPTSTRSRLLRCFNGARPWRPGRALSRLRRARNGWRLQRGPALEAGKGTGCAAATACWRCFNGARPWRQGRGGPVGLQRRRVPASTGPGLGGREGSWRPACPACARPCFNGARPWRPGRDEEPDFAVYAVESLQRGPALEAGKGVRVGADVDPPGGLQRGPALEAGKGALPAARSGRGLASTGPGLGGREGEAEGHDCSRRSAVLQRGPALEAGKGVTVQHDAAGVLVASTGPGLGGREGAPLDHGRGRRGRRLQRGPALEAGKGASGCPATPSSRPRFNGARPWRPGRERQLSSQDLWRMTLQRGPALEAGKGHVVQHVGDFGLRVLQRGPALEAGKGTSGVNKDKLRLLLLQRGPALEAGKGWSRTRRPRRPHRFNGARPWRPGRGDVSGGDEYNFGASTGPGLGGREGKQSTSPLVLAASVSLQRGPALEAGKGPRASPTHARHRRLQRGPALEAGKGSLPAPAARAASSRFNGARPWRPGRAARGSRSGGRLRRASTGPGLGGREGATRLAIGLSSLSSLQRGPALEAGKGATSRPGHRWSARFNGARPWRPGRVPWLPD